MLAIRNSELLTTLLGWLLNLFLERFEAIIAILISFVGIGILVWSLVGFNVWDIWALFWCWAVRQIPNFSIHYWCYRVVVTIKWYNMRKGLEAVQPGTWWMILKWLLVFSCADSTHTHTSGITHQHMTDITASFLTILKYIIKGKQIKIRNYNACNIDKDLYIC